MQKFDYRKMLSGLAVLPVTLCAQDKQPNVIIMYIDDMGIGDVSCFGGTYTPTPNIDRLAQQGLSFTQYYSAAPVSSPSRCGLITGQFPLEHGINTFMDTRAANRRVEQLDYLNPSAPSIARAFQQAGYATAHIGKWHLGGGRDVTDAPGFENYGYDEHVSTYESPDPDPIITSTRWIWAASDSVKRWDRTAYFVDKSLEFIRRQNGKPFFLNLWPDDMHTPWVPEAFAEMRERWEKEDAFEPVLKEMDVQLGRFLDELDKMGLSENTIVIFTSDNGPAPSFMQRRTLGMRGAKNSLYEGGINMPFIIRYPAKIKAGERNETTIISAMDLYPSLCKMAGIPVEKGYESRGEDMSRQLLGNSSKSRKTDLMWDFGRNKSFNFPGRKENKSPHLAIRRGKWKLLCNDNCTDMELYNLEADRNETTNLVEQNPRLARKLAEKVCAWYEANRLKVKNGE